jgi:KaiC/GvpD/RAD55 family RecA-like ATPase
MCGGGFFRDSIILVSGATGTGKTLTVTQFLAGGVNAGERCLLLAFEESRDQLFRNARGWGMDFERMESDGLLRVVCDYPEVTGLEEWLIRIQAIVREFKPTRVAVDSLSALERGGSIKGFREFVIGLTSFLKHQEMTGLFTATTQTLMGGSSITESQGSGRWSAARGWWWLRPRTDAGREHGVSRWRHRAAEELDVRPERAAGFQDHRDSCHRAEHRHHLPRPGCGDGRQSG